VLAQAAQLQGDEAAAGRHYRALAEAPETAFLGRRGLIAQAVRGGDQEAALTEAREAQRLEPKSPWLLETLFRLQGQAGQWSGAERTLDAMLGAHQLGAGAGRRQQAVVLLAQALAAEDKGDRARGLSLAEEATRLAPELAAAWIAAARLALARGKRRRARKTIERGWLSQPHPELARLWSGLAENEKPAPALARVRALAALHPEHLESRLMVAAAAIAAREFRLARDQLDAVAAGGPARVLRLLAELDRAELGEAAAGDALRRAESAPADADWVCRACGHAAGGWLATCPACGGFDSIDWARPARSAETALAQAS